MNDDYISTADLSRILDVSRQAVQKMLKGENGTKVKQIGKSFLFEIGSLPDAVKEKIQKARNDAVRQLATLKPKHDSDLDFEKELWAAADRLRGNIDAAEYKHIVLGLLFLKYVSDAFYRRRDDLEKRMADPDDQEFFIKDPKTRPHILDDKDQYRGTGIFFIPPKARWEYLREYAMRDDIGHIIEAAMEAIEAENQSRLKGVLPIDRVARTPLEPHILGELVNIFSRLNFNHDLDKEKDILGRVYEYFLGQFASAEGKRGGEFYTPRSIVELLVQILEPYENARIFDPACGSGGMFVQSGRFLETRRKNPTHIAVYGQESNPTTYKLCRMNLAIRGVFGEVAVGSSYYDDKFPDLRADFVLANPPFNAEWEPRRLSESDPRIKFGTPPASNANFMWIQHFIHHLAPNGMAGFVMANGALAVSGREGEIRKKLIEADLVDVIIACPPKLFYNVTLPVSLWFVAKNKGGDRFRTRSGETLFIDARDTFEQISRKQVRFTPEQIGKIAGAVRAWRLPAPSEARQAGGEKDEPEYKDIAGFCKAVKIEEIVKAGFVLTPGRFVGLADEIDDGIPFEEKIKKLSAELKEAFKKSGELEGRIIDNLKKLGV